MKEEASAVTLNRGLVIRKRKTGNKNNNLSCVHPLEAHAPTRHDVTDSHGSSSLLIGKGRLHCVPEEPKARLASFENFLLLFFYCKTADIQVDTLRDFFSARSTEVRLCCPYFVNA